jgi:hypothetical protein
MLSLGLGTLILVKLNGRIRNQMLANLVALLTPRFYWKTNFSFYLIVAPDLLLFSFLEFQCIKDVPISGIMILSLITNIFNLMVFIFFDILQIPKRNQITSKI